MMMLLTSRAGRWILSALVVMSIIGGAYLVGRHDAREAAKIERLEREQETRDILGELENETRNLDDGDLADRISR